MEASAMLRNIPGILSPDLMKILLEMGHSDCVVIADANFPAAACAKRLILLEGVEVPALLEGMLPFFPLDSFVPHPVTLMQHLDSEPTPEIWQSYDALLRRWDTDRAFREFRFLERPAFYDAAKSAYAVVQTATTARYANILLQKGVV